MHLSLLPLLVVLVFLPDATLSTCRTTCATIPILYPFGIDDGCGAPQFRRFLSCNTSSIAPALFFVTPTGNYKVQSIDYRHRTVTVFDPDMSTCTILQPHHDLVLSDVQYALMPPSSDTVFALMNCSVDSPVVNHYADLCFNFSGHSCGELYSGCNSFKVFNGTPPCCFTGYSTMKFMSMNILDCTHYTTIYNTDGLNGVVPMDWTYGIKFSFSVPDTGCDRCSASGGSCGFDTETEALTCICSSFTNSTRQCGNIKDDVERWAPSAWLHSFFMLATIFVSMIS